MAANFAGSMFPPDKTTAVRRPEPETAPLRSAASGTAALGSATIFSRAKQNRMASAMASSETVTTSSSSREVTAKVSSPGCSAIRPSAIVTGGGMVTRCPASRDWRVSSAAAGSTPMTAVSGSRALIAVATPEARPPPPTGTRTWSRPSGPAWTNSSRPTVPWPAMMS